MADGMSAPGEALNATDEHAAPAPIGSTTGARSSRGEQRQEASPHSHKFRVVTGGLIGLALGAVVAAVAILAGGGSAGPSAPWSSWSPADNGSAGAREIADHVAPLYRISPIDQLAVVTVVNVSSSGNVAGSSSGLQVAVRTDPASSAVSLLNGNTVAYNLCGIGGPNCAIGVGKPSADRLLLLRREALELALYTFKYVSGTDNVVAILPPGRSQTTSTLTPKPPRSTTASTTKTINAALLFLHGEVKPWLDQPVTSTLPETFPPTVAEMPSAPEAGLVEQITARGLFGQHLVQAQDGSNLIVLDALPPQ